LSSKTDPISPVGEEVTADEDEEKLMRESALFRCAPPAKHTPLK